MSEMDMTNFLRRSSSPGLEFIPIVDTFLESHPSTAVGWCVAPLLYRTIAPEGGRAAGLLEVLRASATAIGGPTGLDVVEAGGALLATASTNQRRVMLPIIRAVAHASQSVPRQRRIPAVGRLRSRHVGEAHRLYEAFVRHCSGRGLDVDRPMLKRMLSRAVRCLDILEQPLHEVVPQVVVVATQHGVEVRALLLLARALGVPSLYVPHAPVAANALYADLPFDVAVLRGSAEVELYGQLGAKTDGMLVAGNPSVEAFECPTVDASLGPVLAVPSGSGAALRLIEFVASVCTEGVVVAPHPGSDRSLLRRRLPSSWRLWENGSTFDLLRRGPWAVLQFSSGVAWEAMYLGLPTVELRFDDGPPNYPVIQSPPVHFADGPESLRAALIAAAEESQSTAAREALRKWAEAWCARTGAGAAQVAAEAVVAVAARGQRRRLVLDRYENVRPSVLDTEGPG